MRRKKIAFALQKCPHLFRVAINKYLQCLSYAQASVHVVYLLVLPIWVIQLGEFGTQPRLPLPKEHSFIHARGEETHQHSKKRHREAPKPYLTFPVCLYQVLNGIQRSQPTEPAVKPSHGSLSKEMALFGKGGV